MTLAIHIAIMGDIMKKEINVILGSKIWDARKRARLTREQLAERLNVSVRFLADVESGEAGVSLSTLKALCVALDVSADYLLGNETEDDGKLESVIKKLGKIPDKYMENVERILDELLNMT